MAGKLANAIFASEIEKIAVETNTTINTEDLNIFCKTFQKLANAIFASEIEKRQQVVSQAKLPSS